MRNARPLHPDTEIMIRTVGRTIGLSLLYAAAIEFPLALLFWYVGIPAARPSAPALLLAFSQLPGVAIMDGLQLLEGELPLVAANDVLRPTLEHTGALALINSVVLSLLMYIVLRTAELFAAGSDDDVEEPVGDATPAEGAAAAPQKETVAA